MSNLLKSKFFLGALVVAVMFTFAFTSGVSKANADCTITKTLKVGSKGAEVMCLQAAVGATADGSFGPKTKAAVKAWQAAHGLVADGIFGAKSRAAWAGTVVVTPPTGSLCPNGMTLASNCTQAPGSTTGGMTGTGNGYLTDFNSDSGNRVSTVYESDTDKVVAGFKTTARLADQTVTRVRVTMKNASSGSSSLTKYVSSVSLWRDGTKLATMDASAADRSSSDVFTFNFSGLNNVIKKDDVARYYVSVNGASSIDTNDASGASWTVTFLAAGVSAASPDGSYDTYPSSDIAQTGLTFAKFTNSGVKATVSLASSNPATSTVAVNTTSTPTYGVTLLKFTIKATNSDLTLKKVPIQIASTTAAINNIASTFKLLRGDTVMDTADSATAGSTTNGTTGAYAISSSAFSGTGATCGSTSCGYLFQNLSSPSNKIMAGETAEFTVVADVKGENSNANFAEGDSLTATLANADVLSQTYFNVQDKNGDNIGTGSSIRVGSAVGNKQTFRANGVNVVMGTVPTPTVQTNTSGQITAVQYVIPLTVTAYGNTLYVGTSVQLASAATASNAFAVVFEDSSAPSSAVTSSTTATYALSTTAPTESNGYRLDSGVPRTFTITVDLTAPYTYGNSYRVRVAQIRTFTEGGLVTGTSSDLLPVESFRTNFQRIDN